MIRELKEVVYQFEISFIMDSSKYDLPFGNVTPTLQRGAWHKGVAT